LITCGDKKKGRMTLRKIEAQKRDRKTKRKTKEEGQK
jgi:hypothetical protein